MTALTLSTSNIFHIHLDHSMKSLNSLAAKLTRFLGYIGVFAIFLMMLHIVLDVFLRSMLNSGVPATEELVTRYYMVTLAILPLAWVEWNRAMISVEVFGHIFNGRSGVILTTLSNTLCLTIYAIFTYTTWLKAADQFQIGSYVMSLNFPMPVWPTYFVLPAAFGLAAVIILLRLPSNLKQLFRGAGNGN